MQDHPAVRSQPGPFDITVFEQLAQRRGRVEDRGEVGVADAREGVGDQRGDRRRVLAVGDHHREPGDVAQPDLGVEQALVQGGRAPAGRDRGRGAQLRVDEQGGLVEPEQLAL